MTSFQIFKHDFIKRLWQRSETEFQANLQIELKIMKIVIAA